MSKIFLAAILALPLVASAQEPIITTYYDLTVSDAPSGVSMFFGLMPGGCLHGPAVFKGRDGSEILRLSADAQLGSGCASATGGESTADRSAPP